MLFLLNSHCPQTQSHANTAEMCLYVSFLDKLSISHMMLHSLHYIVILNYQQWWPGYHDWCIPVKWANTVWTSGMFWHEDHAML